MSNSYTKLRKAQCDRCLVVLEEHEIIHHKCRRDLVFQREDEPELAISELGKSCENILGYPDDNPKTAQGVKKLGIQNVPPSIIAAIAMAMADGAAKYGPYNYRDKRVTMSIYIGAALRHIFAYLDGEENAEDSGAPHLGHAMACLGIIVDAMSIGMMNDDRPKKGAFPKMIKQWENENAKRTSRQQATAEGCISNPGSGPVLSGDVQRDAKHADLWTGVYRNDISRVNPGEE